MQCLLNWSWTFLCHFLFVTYLSLLQKIGTFWAWMTLSQQLQSQDCCQVLWGWYQSLKQLQGVRLERSKSFLNLLQKYEFYCPPESTRGSPDMVHLVFNAYKFSRRQYKGTIALQTITFVTLEPKIPFLWNLENLKNSLS